VAVRRMASAPCSPQTAASPPRIRLRTCSWRQSAAKEYSPLLMKHAVRLPYVSWFQALVALPSLPLNEPFFNLAGDCAEPLFSAFLLPIELDLGL
jgi:hypothetical protein